MNLTIDVDHKALETAMKRSPITIKGKVETWIYRTALMTEREAKRQVPPNVDTGRLESSIHTNLGVMRATVKPQAKYAMYVHEGRRPGKMPPFQPGSDLNTWATKRGMNPFLVARSIGRKGTKGNPFMDKAFKIVRPRAQRDAQILLGDIVRAL